MMMGKPTEAMWAWQEKAWIVRPGIKLETSPALAATTIVGTQANLTFPMVVPHGVMQIPTTQYGATVVSDNATVVIEVRIQGVPQYCIHLQLLFFNFSAS